LPPPVEVDRAAGDVDILARCDDEVASGVQRRARRGIIGLVQRRSVITAVPVAPFEGIWLQLAGFIPGQRMHFAFDYRNRCLTISQWRE